MKYKDLHKKTIFDLTTHGDVLDQIVASELKDHFISNVSDTGRATSFLELAELTGNRELERAVLRQFKKELADCE